MREVHTKGYLAQSEGMIVNLHVTPEVNGVEMISQLSRPSSPGQRWVKQDRFSLSLIGVL